MRPASGPRFPARLSRSLTLALSIVALGLVLVGGTSVALALLIHGSNQDVEREYGHIRELDAIHAAFHDVLFELHQVDSTNAAVRTAAALQLCDDLSRQLDAFAAIHEGELESRQRERKLTMVAELRRLGAEVRTIAGRMASTGRFSGSDVQWLDAASRRVPRIVDALGGLDRLQIARRLERSQALLRAMVLLHLVAIGAGGALVAVGSVAAKRGLADPLRQLSGAAALIAEGRLETRVPVRASNEIGQLSDAFNVMCDRLEARERELRAAQAALEQKVGETRALYRLGTDLSRLHELDRILESVVHNARDLLQADAAALCQLDPTRQELVTKSRSGPPEAFRSEAEPGEPERLGRAVLVKAVSPRTVLRPEYARAHLAAPLRLGEQDLGVIWVASREERTFTAEQAELLAGLATHAAIAIERARLSDEVRSLAAEQERARLAREMHDGLAQSLGLIHLTLQAALDRVGDAPAVAAALREMVSVSGEAYDEVRRSIFELRSAASRGSGLVPTLTEYLHEFTAQTGIGTEVAASGGAFEHLPLSTEVQTVRIIQEALTNVRKHARARSARVSLERSGPWLRVAVEDDGRGWDKAAQPERLHFGLQVMRERAEATGGHLEIDTAPGRGTRVVATLPAGAA